MPGKRYSSSRYYRSILFPTTLLGCFLIITMAIQVMLFQQATRHVASVKAHIVLIVRLQGINLAVQHELANSLRDENAFTAVKRRHMQTDLGAVLESQRLLTNSAQQALVRAHQALVDAKYPPVDALIFASTYSRTALERQTRTHQQLIENVDRATTLTLQIALLVLVVFTACAALLLYLARQRMLAALKRLSFLMRLLGRRHDATLPVFTLDPALRAVTENYNATMLRLAQLEEKLSLRKQGIDSQVQDVTRVLLGQQCMLLRQQHSVANVEKLAAVDEIAARFAHELRNPLANMKMVFANVCEELNQTLESDKQIQRLQSVIDEVDRMTTVLNSLLEQSRYSPEPLRHIVVATVVAELFVLVRYRVAEPVRLEQEVADDIVCDLPEASLRQALLNLILNAGHAIGEHVGEIKVSASCDNGILTLMVCDDGPGFPPAMLRSGIPEFASRRPNGPGLGLVTVQRFAHEMGGSIRLSNVAPHGARVTLELPCRRNDA